MTVMEPGSTGLPQSNQPTTAQPQVAGDTAQPQQPQQPQQPTVPEGTNDAAAGQQGMPDASGFMKWIGIGGLAAAVGGAVWLGLKGGGAGGLKQLGLKGAFMPASMALGGAGAAWMGLRETGRAEGQKQVEEIANPIIEELTTSNNIQGSLLEQLAQAGRVKEGEVTQDPTTGMPVFTPSDGGAGTDDTGQGGPSLNPNPDGTTDTPDGTGTGTGDPQVGAPDAPVLDPAQWTAQALIGQSVVVENAATTDGFEVAAGGAATLTAVVGDAAGHATYEDAMRAALNTLSSDAELVNYQRAVVIEHDGKFHPFRAELGAGGSPMPAANGELAGWGSVTWVSAGDTGAWVGTQWNATAGLSITPMGANGGSGSTLQVLPMGGSAAEQPGGSQNPVPEEPTTDGAGVPATTFDPSTPLTSGFQMGNAVMDGIDINGGTIQLQRLLDERGFASDAEAVEAARAARTADAEVSRWDRWIIAQGENGRWYAYEGSIVNADVPGMPDSARPAYVLGYDAVGGLVSEYFDGEYWQAMRG